MPRESARFVLSRTAAPSPCHPITLERGSRIFWYYLPIAFPRVSQDHCPHLTSVEKIRESEEKGPAHENLLENKQWIGITALNSILIAEQDNTTI